MNAIARDKPPGPATLEDLLALPEEQRYELIDGELVPKEAASAKHWGAQLAIGLALRAYRRRGGSGGPGGWLFASEVLVEFGPKLDRRPDVAGWRREHLPELPSEVPVRVRPDWICEILSPSNASNDTIEKMRLYHRVGVPHYWLLDPRDETLAVYRWTKEGYLHVLGARRGERVKAEPFDDKELLVGSFFGEDDEEE